MIVAQRNQRINIKGTHRINTLSTAYNGFVFVQICDDPADIQKLVHLDQSGKRIKQFCYADSIDTFGMFNEKEVIVMNVSKNLIDIIDLSTYEIRSYPHQYKFPNTAYMDIHLFYNTKIFCIQQKGSTGDHRLILTYYLYSPSQIMMLQRFQSTVEWNCQNYIEKLNNNSKIGWWKNYQQNVNKNQGKPFLFVGQMKILQSSISSNNLTLSKMWQMSDNNFMFVCDNINKRQEGNNNLIFDANKKILRQSKIIFPNNKSSQLIDYYYLGQISVFHTFQYAGGQSLQTPVYFIHNERQEIITEAKWKCSGQTIFYNPAFDPSMLITTFRQNCQSQTVEIKTMKLITLKQTYLHFLLHLNQDFDDDLLGDAIDLLQ